MTVLTMTIGIPPHVRGANTVTGQAVKNAQGEDLGHITDLMIDMDGGRIAYAVLSLGWISGSGDKLFAVPWSALQPDTERGFFVLNVDKQRLKEAPGFDKTNWPPSERVDWHRSIHNFYRQKPYWERLEHYQG